MTRSDAVCACMALLLELTCLPAPPQADVLNRASSAPAGQTAGHRSHAGGHSSRGRGSRQGGIHAVHPQPSAGESQLAVQLLSGWVFIRSRGSVMALTGAG